MPEPADKGARALARRSAAAATAASAPAGAVARRAFSKRLQARFGEEALAAAVGALAAQDPRSSARQVLDPSQRRSLIATVVVAAGACLLAPAAFAIAVNALAALYFVTVISVRLFFTILTAAEAPRAGPAASASPDIAPPTISILLPLYREAKSLPTLARSIAALDYPPHLLDVKLILEEGDDETIAAARDLGLDETFDLIVTPAAAPKTKPKACNYGLHFARGRYTVIYDAEDLPESDQLRKAVAAFDAGPENLVCVQARLNFYNRDDNWITRLFALEYALWFDAFLPALQKLSAPIPLGGTSNFFCTEKLRELGGWDPYNVTEDADLGLRIARRGYQVGVIDSTTFEEANGQFGNWLRQRSRWMKGYIQTWLVHTRHGPRENRAFGWRDFLTTHLLMGGAALSALLTPALWGVFLLTLVAPGAALPDKIVALNTRALTIGNALLVLLALLAPLKRGWFGLAPAAALMPLYWWMNSLAAYKALWQLITRPHFWEKTEHGLSPTALALRASALAALLNREPDAQDPAGASNG